MKLPSLSLLLILLFCITTSSSAKKHSRVRRKTGFSNIISNYFTSNPVFKKAKTKKPRIHLPRKPQTPADQTVLSSIPQPRPIRLGPPIRILPTITLPTLPTVTQRTPTSFQHGRKPHSEQKRDMVPAPLLAGMKDERRLPTIERKGALVRGVGRGAPPEHTFSQLISRRKVQLIIFLAILVVFWSGHQPCFSS